MAFPLCKLMALTGPLSFPDRVVLGIVRGSDRFEVRRVTLKPNAEIKLTLFEFDNQDLIPFQNESQLRFGMNAAVGGQDLGETIINAEDASQGETTTQFRPGGIEGPSYELTYKVLP
jgi:hypothetical protein